MMSVGKKKLSWRKQANKHQLTEIMSFLMKFCDEIEFEGGKKLENQKENVILLKKSWLKYLNL